MHSIQHNYRPIQNVIPGPFACYQRDNLFDHNLMEEGITETEKGPRSRRLLPL